MNTEVTITLPDEVYKRAERLARLANRDITSILSEIIQADLLPNSQNETTLESISALSDEEILELTELQLQPEQDARLSELLDRQQAGTIGESDCTELKVLMQIYQEGLLGKAVP